MHAYLLVGIAREDYSVDQAIRVAKVLSQYGVSLDRRDSHGKTVIETLQERDEDENRMPNARLHKDALVEGLRRLEKQDQIGPGQL